MTNEAQARAANGTSIVVLIGGILTLLMVLVASPFGGNPLPAIVLAAITVALAFPAYTRAKLTGIGLGLTIAGMGLAVGALILIPLIAVALDRA